MLIRYFAIVFGCLGLGELIVALTHIPFPSSIIGMLFLTLFLHFGWIKLQAIKADRRKLLSHLYIYYYQYYSSDYSYRSRLSIPT